jgi:lipopolysaccharide/colanic/teichoic acid biosynthesis glycosyltransferase
LSLSSLRFAASMPGTLFEPSGRNRTQKGLPEAVDRALAFALLVGLAPLLFIAMAAVALEAGRPVFFRQRRIGLGGREFTLLKLRTMRQTEGPSITRAGDARITRSGSFLRRYRFDELPQLLNVLAGDMAIVGPRPEVPRFFDETDKQWQAVVSVKPGITHPVSLGLLDESALLARAAGSVEEYYEEYLLPGKLQAYLAYEKQRTWLSDLRVMLQSVVCIARPSSAESDVDASAGQSTRRD